MVAPLIAQAIEEVKSAGIRVEILKEENNHIGVYLPDYPLPKNIWNRSITSLLILAPLAFPNAKLDMFWVNPGLRLADGRVPRNGNHEENHFGQSWQRFSWHIKNWNPGRDTLLTYLREVIDHRLSLKE